MSVDCSRVTAVATRPSGTAGAKQSSVTDAYKRPASPAASVKAPQVSVRRQSGTTFRPGFVGDLVRDTFGEATQSSAEQARSYSEMVASASRSADRFREDNIDPSDRTLSQKRTRCR